MTQTRKTLYTVLLLLTMILMASANTLIAAVLTTLGEDYGLTEFQKGLPASFGSIGSMVALVTAFGLMRIMKKPYILLLATGLVVGLVALFFFRPAFGLFLGMYVVLGTGIGLMDNLCSSSMADVQNGPRAAMMMNLLHACYGIGSTVTPPIYKALLAGGLKWNELYLVSAGAGMLLFLFCLSLTPGQAALPMYDSMRSRGKIGWNDIVNFFRRPVLRTAVMVIFAVGFLFSGFSKMIVDMGNTAYGEGSGTWALSLFFLGVTCARLLTPLLGIKPKDSLRFSGFGAFLLLICSLLIPSKTVLWIASAGAGLLSGPEIPFVISLACGEMKENTLLVSTVLFLSMYIGQTISTPLMSAMDGLLGVRPALALCYLFALVYSVFALVGFREKKTDESEGNR